MFLGVSCAHLGLWDFPILQGVLNLFKGAIYIPGRPTCLDHHRSPGNSRDRSNSFTHHPIPPCSCTGQCSQSPGAHEGSWFIPEIRLNEKLVAFRSSSSRQIKISCHQKWWKTSILSNLFTVIYPGISWVIKENSSNGMQRELLA